MYVRMYSILIVAIVRIPIITSVSSFDYCSYYCNSSFYRDIHISLILLCPYSIAFLYSFKMAFSCCDAAQSCI